MIDEKTLQEGLQTIFQGMTEFADADVVINDMSILDRLTTLEGPFLMIGNAITPQVSYDKNAGRYSYLNISTTVVVSALARNPKEYWDEFRDVRQACFERIAASTYVTIGGLSCVVNNYRAEADPYEWYPTEESEAPLYISQELILEIEEL